jgi:hypothetical protein
MQSTASDPESMSSTRDEPVEHGAVGNVLPMEAVQHVTKSIVSRPAMVPRFIHGVTFITAQELHFVDQQREKYLHIGWFTEDKQEKAEPSRLWFREEYPWLRAVCTENQYGLLCIDCSEFANDNTMIERCRGAFVIRPYWKLKHKGLEGIDRNISADDVFSVSFQAFDCTKTVTCTDSAMKDEWHRRSSRAEAPSSVSCIVST